MDYATLRAELATDPLGRGYAAMTAAQAAASLNAVDRQVANKVNLRDLIVYLLKAGKWIGIEDEATTGALNARAECRAFMVIMNNVNFTDLDLSDPIVRGMLGNIKTAGLLDAADQAAILAMGSETMSRAAERGLGTVLEKHIAASRAGAGG